MSQSFNGLFNMLIEREEKVIPLISLSYSARKCAAKKLARDIFTIKDVRPMTLIFKEEIRFPTCILFDKFFKGYHCFTWHM